MRIVLDAMGGDNAPAAIVEGAVLASKVLENTIVLVGDEGKILSELKKYSFESSRIEVKHASEVIENEDSPVKAIRSKKDSSMVVGINMLKDGSGDVFISAGNTGALMAGGIFNLGRIQGIDRPAIATAYPILGGRPVLLIDSGANSECKPENLLEFAMMGSLYMEHVFGRENPSVGLINIGAEEKKGNTLTKAAYLLLKESGLNFYGNVEGRDVPFGVSDIYVCDGFTGNIILKLSEGLGLSILKTLKRKLTAGMRAKLGAMLLLDKIKEIKSEFDYSEYGGAPILGVKGAIVKMHGSSDANAVKNTIIKAVPFAEHDVVSLIQDSVMLLQDEE